MVFLEETDEERQGQVASAGQAQITPTNIPLTEGGQTLSAGAGPGKGQATGGASAPPPGVSPTGASSSGFQDIQDFLRVNQGGAQKIGKILGQDLAQRGQAARGAIQAGQQGFEQQIQAAQNTGTGFLESIRSAPSSITGDEQRLAQFRQAQTGIFSGPQSIESTKFQQPISSALGRASEGITLADTASGRSELLRQARPQQTGGELLLNQSLLEADPSSRTALQSRQEDLRQLPDIFAQASQSAIERSAQAKAGAEQTAAQIQSGLEGARTAFETGLDERVTSQRGVADAQTGSLVDTLNALRNPDFNRIILDAQLSRDTDRLSRSDRPGFIISPEEQFFGQANEETLGLLGVEQEQFSDLTSLLQELESIRALGQSQGDQIRSNNFFFNPPSDFELTDPFQFGEEDFFTSTPSDVAINRQNVATQADFTRLQALNELAGVESRFITGGDQLGTATTDLSDLQIEQLINELQVSLIKERQGFDFTIVDPATGLPFV